MENIRLFISIVSSMRIDTCETMYVFITSMNSTHIPKSKHNERLPILPRQCANIYIRPICVFVCKQASKHACLIAHICQANAAACLRKFNKLATFIRAKKKLVSFQNEDIIDHFGGTNNYAIPQYATLLSG